MKREWRIAGVGGIVVLMAALVSVGAHAEQILLKNGQIIEGEIVEYTDEYIRVERDGAPLKVWYTSMGPQTLERVRARVRELEAEKMRESPSEAAVRALLDKAQACLREERYLEALPLLTQAAALKPDSGRIWFLRGNANGQLKRYRDAVADYERALAIRSDRVEVWLNLGLVYEGLKEYARAAEMYSEAIKLSPNDLSPVLSRADAYRMNNDADAAIFDYTTVIKADPKNGYAYARRAQAYYLKGDYHMAWRGIYQAQENGFDVPASLIEKLQREMPDPFREKTSVERYQDSLDWVVTVVKQNKVLFLVAGGFFVFGLILLSVIFVRFGKKDDVEDLESRLLPAEGPRLDAAVLAEAAPVPGPEELAWDYVRPPLVKRIGAFLFDVAVSLGVAWGIDLLAGTQMLLIWFGILFFVRDLWRGHSLGKYLAGTVVVNEFGRRGRFWENLIRNFFIALVMWIAFLIVNDQWVLRYVHENIGIVFLLTGLGVEAVVFLLRQDRCRLGDLLANTMVHDQRPGERGGVMMAIGILLVGLASFSVYWGYAQGGIELTLAPRYESLEMGISFDLPRGWEIREESSGIVLEHWKQAHDPAGPQAGVIMSRDETMSLYSIEQGYEIFKQYVGSLGLAVVDERDQTIHQGRTVKVMIALNQSTDDAIIVAVFKQFDYGPLYIVQCSTKGAIFRQSVAAVYQQVIRSIRFPAVSSEAAAEGAANAE